jgi:hypothetical protein
LALGDWASYTTAVPAVYAGRPWRRGKTMRLKVKKLPHGDMIIEYAACKDAGPMKLTLDRKQSDLLIALLTAAQRSDRFEFEIDL